MRAIVEERIAFASGPLQLSGILSYPEQNRSEQAVLLCSPHPHFAGDMRNNVVGAVSERLAHHSVVLRFEYRGVGDSEIALDPGLSVFDHWTEVEETRDYRDAVADVNAAARTLAATTESLDGDFSVVGYSFGAAVGMLFGRQANAAKTMVALAPPLGKISFDFLAGCTKPSLHLLGRHDFLYSDDKWGDYRRTVGPAAQVFVLDDGDHFFRDDEDSLACRVDEFLRGARAA